ncbi:MAG: glycosyltransferase family 4 protein, partial [Nitrosarchaeum sp.]
NMRIGIVVDYGSFANASSLNLIAKKIFSELGKLMNQRKDFTIAALRYEEIGIGNINQHYDCICVPNMGGYRFPSKGLLTSNNLIIGLIGIDEVVLGRQVYKTEANWNQNKSIIKDEVTKWEKYSDKIKIIHVATQSEKIQMVKYLKIPEEKIQIISLGVDHEEFFPIKDKEIHRKKILGKFFMKDKPYFIHISESNWARKNIFRILDAFEEIKKNGINYNLIIIGRADTSVIKRANEIDGVKVLGFVSNEHLVEILQAAEAMVFPSLHEGFGLPTVEALACGIPIIASNVFSSPEVIGDAGLYVDPYNTKDISEKMALIAKNHLLRSELSAKAILQAKKYSWEKTAANLLELIEKNVKNASKFDFDSSIEISARRTLVTICNITPELREIAIPHILEFNYEPIVRWANEVGLEKSNVSEFLLPFKKWIEVNSKY